jgi:outer membrane protein OmpA-like peptidoglycan-associated protein
MSAMTRYCSPILSRAAQTAHARLAPAPPRKTQSLGNQASLRRLQTKLRVGSVNDPLEREADAVADRVMRMPAPDLSLASAPTQVSRKCAACEEEDKATMLQAKSAKPTAAAASEAPSIVHDVISAPGRPLNPETRAFFEPRFGVDFGRVRLHTDMKARQSATAINARAYTVGSNVVLRESDPEPVLLAHELAHVVQQREQEQPIRRTSDFDIRGVNPQAASQPSIIFFDFGQTTIPSSEMAKITALATPAGTSLTLNGFSSEEGTAAANLATVNARIAAVQAALQTAGHTGPIVANPQPSAGVGQLDYRSVRAVEIVPAGAAPATPACQVTAANPHPEDKPCGTSFTSVQPIAIAKVSNAIGALAAPTPATTTIFNSIFPGVAQTTILGRLVALTTQLVNMGTPTGSRCHNTCDGACSRPGYNSGHGPTAVMTLCPDFIDSFGVDDRVEMLMHEGMHATPGSPVVDTAYRSQRLIGALSGAQAETNTDSYVSLILRLQPGAPTALPGGPPTDPIGGAMSPSEGDAGRRALAFMEKWVEIAEWDTSQLYEAVKRNIGRAGGWDPGDNYHAQTQHVIGWLLTLTDPGPAPPYMTTPTTSDQIKIAGIHDRYQRMSNAVAGTSITFNKGATDAWAANMAPSVAVSPPFFALNATDQVTFLLKLLATSMPDVPPGLRSNYADAAGQIRWHKGGVGP